LINQHTDQSQPGVHVVAFDERAGAQLAVEHLLALGHQRIGYLGLGNRQRSNRLRLAGYQDALDDASLAPEPARTRIVPEAEMQTLSDTGAGEAYLDAFIDAGATAVFCYNDRVAIGALLACRRAHIAVPEALSLVGFDDIEAAQWVSPPLTTVRQPRRQMGRLAMGVMLDLLEDRTVTDHVLAPELVQRESTLDVTLHLAS
jgi:LacI family transcriptional regulator/LacI family repressor for deo operon, udp, cdd, tsx, nupC, and nupG